MKQQIISLLHEPPPFDILDESEPRHGTLLPTHVFLLPPSIRATGRTPVCWRVVFGSAEAAGEVYQRFVLMRRTCGVLPSDSPLRDLEIRPFAAGGGQAGSQHVERQMASVAVRVRDHQSEAAAAAAAPAVVQEVDRHMAQEMGGLNLLANARGDNRGQPEHPTVVRRLFDPAAREMQPQPEQRVENAPMQSAPQQPSHAPPPPLPPQSNPQPHPPCQHAQPLYGAFPPSGGPMGAPPMPPQHAYGPYSYGPPSYWSPPYPCGHYPPPPAPECYHAHQYAAAAAHPSHVQAFPQYPFPHPSFFYGNPPPAPSRQ
ncbi:MAG: hypothetical protein P4L83_16220 [Nevskia sp.]|nr:hypothetical protein [Nevskia sp.]